MNRITIIFIALVALALIFLGYNYFSADTVRRFNDKQTLRARDKIPYGMEATVRIVNDFFKTEGVSIVQNSPNLYYEGEKNEIVFYVSPYMNLSYEELESIQSFASGGNHVVLIAMYFSPEAQDFFSIYNHESGGEGYKLNSEIFQNENAYTYPGKAQASYFSNFDLEKSVILGTDSATGYPNFLKYYVGQGSILLHSSPAAFTNYFVLQKNNHEYLQAVLSALPSNPSQVHWNEYFFNKPNSGKFSEPSWLRVLWNYPAFRAAFMLALLSLVLYVILGMRRKQRIIPVRVKAANDSLEFVNTMGRLYYFQANHLNLAFKMSSQFLEYVRTNFGLSTEKLDDDFRKSLVERSGYDDIEIENILSFIRSLGYIDGLNAESLKSFYLKLENFYGRT